MASLLIRLIFLSLSAQALAHGSPDCKEVAFSVSGTASNRNLTSILGANITADLLQNVVPKLPLITTSGSQTLAGWFCLPTVLNENNKKLQILFPSITGNRESWTALGGTPLNSPPYPAHDPAKYSWVKYATAQGYATLALDRLGNGRSSHPDPVLVVQQPYEIALYHDLNRQIRAGLTGQIPILYETLIWVGNSYGSQLGAGSAQAYPNDWQAFILTGYSKRVLPSLQGISLQNPQPASTVWPDRFGDLPGAYLTSPQEDTRTNSFFGSHEYVDFEQTVAQLFWEREDVVSFGQFISVYSITPNAPAYRGRVLVLTGEEDQAFCGPGSSSVDPKPQCGTLLAETGTVFPNADYNYQNISRAGHALILHESAQYSMKLAHCFLAGEKYANNA